MLFFQTIILQIHFQFIESDIELIKDAEFSSIENSIIENPQFTISPNQANDFITIKYNQIYEPFCKFKNFKYIGEIVYERN